MEKCPVKYLPGPRKNANDRNRRQFLVAIMVSGIVFGTGGPALALPPGAGFPPPDEHWQTYQGAGGTVVEYPAGIFSIPIGPPPKGVGDRYKSPDGRYEFAAYTLDNSARSEPHSYLEKHLVVNPASITYRRVTARFFALSSVRGDRIYYSRCNFRNAIHCLYVEYPKSEKIAWDRIVTRMSLSLRS
jgi:hypothetical protein